MKFDLARSLELLERTPEALSRLLRDLPEAWTRANEGPDTWSAFDIVGHLIAGERSDWMTRTHTILEHGEARRFTPFDRFSQFETSRGKSMNKLLDEFADLRLNNLVELKDLELSEEDLVKRGTHPDFGPVTLGQLLATWTVHDLNHLAQVSRVMAKQYRGEVGPWAAHLPVLTRT
jgi:hypothetical protein